MAARASRYLCLLLTVLIACLPASANDTQKKKKKEKPPELRVENYFGGIFMMGEGGIPNGPCFKINGRVSAGDFFNDLKSYETDDGVLFKRGQNEVSDFPDNLYLSFAIHDQPCDLGLQPVGTGVYLTQQEMSQLQLSLYWKSGVDLRPVGNIKLLNHTVDQLLPYAKSLVGELPKRYIWSYELNIPAAGVPLTDSLVLIFRNPGGHIVARVAARL